MTMKKDPPEHHLASAPFAATLREAMQRKRLPLRAIRQRLIDLGYDISLATLSLWQSGARRPERAVSIDILRELEQILGLDDGQLIDALGPSRRVGATKHDPFTAQLGYPQTEITHEPESELRERSGAVGFYVDADRQVVRVVNRTLWQAQKDGARDAVVFVGADRTEYLPVSFTGTIGCDIVDQVIDPEQPLIRAVLRLREPLRQGELALTERESIMTPQSEPDCEMEIVAPRRQAELLLYAVFDPTCLPQRCRIVVEVDGNTHVQAVRINGDSAAHAEFNFGPGIATLQWDW